MIKVLKTRYNDGREKLFDIAYQQFDGLGVDSYNRLGRFMAECHTVSDDKLYWVALRNAYEGSDDLGRYDIKDKRRLFLSPRPYRELLMDFSEREFFNGLPDKVTIYRGMTQAERESENYGLSWTLSKTVADFFAFKFRRNQTYAATPKCVVRKAVSKEELIAFCDAREEKELIFVDSKTRRLW